MHKYNDENKYDINIPFKHTTNITLINAIKSNNGHKLILQLHPQNALLMNDYLDVIFIKKKEKENNNKDNDDDLTMNDNKEMENDNDNYLNESKNNKINEH